MNIFQTHATSDLSDSERMSRDWEFEQRSERRFRDQEINYGLELEREAQRSIWDEYQERFDRENYIDLAEFRKPAHLARMQMQLFGDEVA